MAIIGVSWYILVSTVKSNEVGKIMNQFKRIISFALTAVILASLLGINSIASYKEDFIVENGVLT